MKNKFKFQTLNQLIFVLILVMLIAVTVITYWQGERAIHLQRVTSEIYYYSIFEFKEVLNEIINTHSMVNRFIEIQDNKNELKNLVLYEFQQQVQNNKFYDVLNSQEAIVFQRMVNEMSFFLKIYLDEEKTSPGSEDAFNFKEMFESKIDDLQIYILKKEKKLNFSNHKAIIRLLQGIDSALDEYSEKERISLKGIQESLSKIIIRITRLKSFFKEHSSNTTRFLYFDRDKELMNPMIDFEKTFLRYRGIVDTIMHEVDNDAPYEILSNFELVWNRLDSQGKYFEEKLSHILHTKIEYTIESLEYSQAVSLVAAFFSLVFVFLFLTFLRRLLMRRLDTLKAGAKQFSQGELNKMIVIDSNDEFAELADHFNLMAECLRMRSEQLKLANDSLMLRVEELKISQNEAQIANRAKSEFLANMSHELRTPLHGILSFARFGIKNIEKENKVKNLKYFERINTSGERLLVLVNDLLDISKFEAGKMLYNLTETHLLDIVESCIDEQQIRIEEQDLKITLDTEGSTRVICDATRIGQVITNLLSNAIKFSQQHSVIKIEIKPDNFKSPEGELLKGLKLSMTNRGIEIPVNELETVFDKFAQSSGKNSGTGGTGLGLSICYEIIKGHNGKIWANNTIGYGPVFSFIIPDTFKVV